MDTTASMGGVIRTTKQKIWSICNQVAAGKPTPVLRIGLVAYRDRGDKYVTKITGLTDDLDAVYGDLMELNAEGGGDIPEGVNRALSDSVTKMKWTADKNALKIVFLVGDAPPKKYVGETHFPMICKTAAKNQIIINTIQCGRDEQTAQAWKQICGLAKGAYVQIDPYGGITKTVATPFDKELAEINVKLTDTTLTFGNKLLRTRAEAKKRAAKKLPQAAAVERAGIAGKTGVAATYDLLDNIEKGIVKLEDLKKTELPNALQTLNLQQQRAYLENIAKKRKPLLKRAATLDQQRAQFIMTTLNPKSKKAQVTSFDGQVLRILQAQALRANISYGKSKKK